MNKLIHTFSIVAYDPRKREWGVAVQSKFLAAAAVVSWARANAGAVATQSYANVTYGFRGLDLMQEGLSAEDTIQQLIENDENMDQRQVGVVDKTGKAASFTGKKCHEWAGHIVGEGYACQGNILVPGTVEAMAEKFEKARQGDGELADWLVSALEAGQDAEAMEIYKAMGPLFYATPYHGVVDGGVSYLTREKSFLHLLHLVFLRF